MERKPSRIIQVARRVTQAENLRKLPWIRRRIICRSFFQTGIEHYLTSPLEFKRAFGFLDRDNDGFISADDLMEICILMGDNIPSKQDVFRWIRVFDMNHDFKISFEEFVSTLIVKMDHFMTPTDIEQLFRRCDSQNQGYITIGSLIQAMESQGNHLHVDDAKLMMGEADTNRKIEFIEFSRRMMKMRKDILFHFGSLLAT